MKILRVISDLYPDVVGGMGIHGHKMSKDHYHLGHDVTVYTSKRKVNHTIPADDKTPSGTESLLPDQPSNQSPYKIERFSNIRIFGNAISLSLMLKLFKKRRDFDVIHAHSHLFFSTFACALIRSLGSSPLIVTNHGLMSQTVPGWINNLYNRTVSRWIFTKADKILCYTEEEKSQIVDWGITPDKIIVIHNGVDTTKFTPEKTREDHEPGESRCVHQSTQHHQVSYESPEADTPTEHYQPEISESINLSGHAEARVFVSPPSSVKSSSKSSSSLESEVTIESAGLGGFIGSGQIKFRDLFAYTGPCVHANPGISTEPASLGILNSANAFYDFSESVLDSEDLGEVKTSTPNFDSTPRPDSYVRSGEPTSSFSYLESQVFVQPKKSLELIWVGRFIPGKGVDDLLDTFAIIHEKKPGCKLLMVGDGPQMGEMKQKIRKHNLEENIQIKSFIPNSQMTHLYQKSAVFILTSLEEGVPRSMLEAMASGLPVVCSALPQIAGVVKKGGVLIPPKDTQKFAESVIHLLSNPQLAEEMGNNARKNVVNNFSWQETVTQTLKAYEDLTKNSKNRE